MAAANDNGHRRVNGRRTWIIVVGLIVAVVVLAAFVSLRRSQVPVRVGRADRETITESIATNGKIEALNNFEAYAPMATTVKKIYVQQGAWVKPGQLLLQLEDANARSQAARARGAVEGRASRCEHGREWWHQGRIAQHPQCSGEGPSRPGCRATESAGDAAFVADRGGLASRSGCRAKPVSNRRGQRAPAAAEAERSLLRTGSWPRRGAGD